MNQRTFRKALRYGFGRAILHLQEHEARPYRDDILDGCLHFWGYDRDFDLNRPEYMFEIITLSGERAFYREQILAAVESATDNRDGNQLLSLVRLFAREGDVEARSALDRALERLPFVYDLVEDALMLEGPAGLVRVLRIRLAKRDAEEDDNRNLTDFGYGVIQAATERWGRRAFATAMREAGRADPQIGTLWKEIQEDEAESSRWKQTRGQQEELPVLTVQQVQEVLTNPAVAKNFSSGHWSSALRLWAKAATDVEWIGLAAELEAMPDDDVRWRRAVQYLYTVRPFPGNPARLIASVQAVPLARMTSAWSRSRAEWLQIHSLNALAKISHPAVRTYALELLATSRWTSHAASLLEANLEDGDLEMLAASFLRERSEWQRHGIALSILKIDTEHSLAESPSVLLMLYERVRCGICRLHIVQRLHAHKVLPESIARECHLDAYFPLREAISEMVPNAFPGRTPADSPIT